MLLLLLSKSFIVQDYTVLTFKISHLTSQGNRAILVFFLIIIVIIIIICFVVI